MSPPPTLRCGSWICTRQSLLGLPAKNFRRIQCQQSDVGNIVECHGKASQLGVVIDDLDKERPVVFENMAPVHVRRAAEPQPRLQNRDASQARIPRSEEHTSELQSLMRISYAVFCLKKKTTNKRTRYTKSI